MGHYRPATNTEVDTPELHAALSSARAFLECSREFERLTLYGQRILRAISRYMQELDSLQSKRKAARAEALEEAAKLQQICEYYEDTPPNGSEFSPEEIRQQMVRAYNLHRFDFHKKTPLGFRR